MRPERKDMPDTGTPPSASDPPLAALELARRWSQRALRDPRVGDPHPEVLRALGWTIHYARWLRVLRRRIGADSPWTGFEFAIPVVSRFLRWLPPDPDLPEICGLALRRLWVHPHGGITVQHWPLPSPAAGVPPATGQLARETREQLRPPFPLLIDCLAGGSERRIFIAQVLLRGPCINPELSVVSHLIHLGESHDDGQTFAFVEQLSPEARQDFERRIDAERFRTIVARGIGRLYLATAREVVRQVRSIWGPELMAALNEICLPQRPVLRYLSPIDPTLARHRRQAVHAFANLPWNALPDDAEWRDFREAIDDGRSPLPHFPASVAPLQPRKLLRAARHFVAASLGSEGGVFARQRDPWEQTAEDRRLTAAVLEGTSEAWWPCEHDWTGWAVLCALGPELGAAPRGAEYISLPDLIDRPFARVRACLEEHTGPWDEVDAAEGQQARDATHRVVTLLSQVARDLLPFLVSVHARVEAELGVPVPATADQDASLITWLRRSDAWHLAVINLTRARVDHWMAQPSSDLRFTGWPGLLEDGSVTLTIDGKLIRVRELLDPLALAVEGSQMDHCLATYARYALTGRNRYLAFEGADRSRSTLEVSIDLGAPEGQTLLRSGQHSGPGNAAPADAHWRAARQLLQWLESDPSALRERVHAIELAAWDKGPADLPDAWQLDMTEFCSTAPLAEIWRRFGRTLPGSLRTALRTALRGTKHVGQ